MLERTSFEHENQVPYLTLLKDIRSFLTIDENWHELNEAMDHLEIEIFRLLRMGGNGDFPAPLQTLSQQYIDLFHKISDGCQNKKSAMEVMLLYSLVNVVLFKATGRFEDASVELGDALEIFDNINPNQMGGLFLEVIRL